MSRARRSVYPAGASGWMVGDHPQRVLDLGSGRGTFATVLAEAGHQVYCLDREPARVARLTDVLGPGLHVAGQVESLPYGSRRFDVVTASQTLHHFAPGLALTEIARVLRPGGRLAVAYSTRDDTVPWVRRLMALLHQADPTAMRGQSGSSSIEAVTESPYFGPVERRNFRTWIPATRAMLIAMVERRPAITHLPEPARQALLDQVAEIYDSSARAPEPLLLPYQTACWRAEVNHAQAEIDELPDRGLEIRL